MTWLQKVYTLVYHIPQTMPIKNIPRAVPWEATVYRKWKSTLEGLFLLGLDVVLIGGRLGEVWTSQE